MAVRGIPRKKSIVEDVPFEEVEQVVVEEQSKPKQINKPFAEPKPLEDMQGTQGDFNPFAENVVER